MLHLSHPATSYPWLQPVWQHLQDYIQQQRVPQAILVTGGAGLGKRQLLESYAQSLLCHTPTAEHQACGVCQSCKLLAADTHPDYLLVEPDEAGKGIGIDKIRQLITKLALKPQFSGYRVVLIEPAELLNHAAANAFLKCLEEPTERTCLVLLCEQPARLPATIRSRCQKLHCPQPESAQAQQWLQQQAISEDADLLLTLAQGAPLLAQQYAEQGLIAIRQAYFNHWLQIAQGKANLVQIAEQWHKQERLELTILLTWMTSWVSDLVKLAQSHDRSQLANPDLSNALQALLQALELKPLFAFYDMLLAARQQLTSQINKQLLIEQLLIHWSQLNTR